MRAFIPAAFMLLSAAILAGEASAQLAAVQACTGIKEDAARLACFDKAAAQLKQAPPAPSVPTTTPAPPASATLAPATTPDSIAIDVTAIETGTDGKLRFTLANGEVWRQSDSVQLKNLGKGPWKGELRKAALGSFLLQVGNKAAVRVRRVD